MVHPDSPFDDYKNKGVKLEKIKNDLGYGKGWFPDKDLKAVIAKYEEMTDTLARRSLRTTKSALHSTERIIDRYREQIDNLLGGGEELDAIEITELFKASENLLKLANAIPTTIKKIADLEEETRKSGDESASKLRGGGDVGMFED